MINSKLGLKLNGQYLELPKGGLSISGDMSNAIFSEEDEGVYSLPFSLPITPINSRLLGSPEELMRRGTTKKDYPGLVVEMFNQPWKSGVLKLRSIKAKTYELNFVADISSLANLIVNKKLSDVDYEGDRDMLDGTKAGITLYARDVMPIEVSTVRVTLTMSTGSIAKEVPYEPYNMFGLLWALADAFNEDPAFVALGFTHAYHEQLFLSFYTTGETPTAVATALNSSGGEVSSGYIRLYDKYLCDKVLEHMNSKAIGNYPTHDYVFFPVRNIEFYSDINDYQGIINNYKVVLSEGPASMVIRNGFQRNDVFNIETNTDYSITPFPYLLYVIERIFKGLQLSVKGNFVEDDEIKKLVIYNNYALDKVIQFSHDGLNIFPYNIWAKTLNIKNHVPDMLIADFLKSLKSFFRLGIFFDNAGKEVEFKTVKSILDDHEYDDWTRFVVPDKEIEQNDTDGFMMTFKRDGADTYMTERILPLTGQNIKPSVNKVEDLPIEGSAPGDVRLVVTRNQFYKCEQVDIELSSGIEWVFYSENQNDYKIGNGKDNVDILGDTLTMHTSTEGNKLIIPQANQPGSSLEFNQGINPFGFRLLFYRGLRQGKLSSGETMFYPLGTAYKWDYNGNVIGNYCLSLEGETGLYNTFHKKYLDLRNNTKPVTMRLNFDEQTFLNPRLDRKKRINNITYLVNKFSYNVSTDGIKEATVKFFKV